MKWKAKTMPKIYNKTKFLLFPMCIQGEWRWLELATYEVEVCCGYDGCYHIPNKWIDLKKGD